MHFIGTADYSDVRLWYQQSQIHQKVARGSHSNGARDILFRFSVL